MQIIFCYIRKQASLWQLCRFFGRKTNTGFARHPLPDDVFESFKYTQTDNKQSGCVHLTGAVVVRMDDHAASHKHEQVVNQEEALVARTGQCRGCSASACLTLPPYAYNAGSAGCAARQHC